MHGTKFVLSCLAALAALLAPLSHAVDLRPDQFAVQGGPGSDGTSAVSAGVVWDWQWRRQARALATAQTELFVSHWQADRIGGGHQALRQAVLLPVLRLQLDRGRSRWFLEGGIGASWLSRDYVTPTKTFSTRWNFYDMVGTGYKFGGGRHELGLRYVHVSNGSLRRPNPGEDFLLLRYATRF